VVITANYSVYSWGKSELGALGHLAKEADRPTKVAMSDLEIIDASCGENFTYFLSA